MIVNSKQKNSRQFKHARNNPATRSESALLPSDNEEEGDRIKTLDDAYQVRATPKSKRELVSLRTKNL